MFRPMRRKLQYLPQDVIENILSTASSGVLSVVGDEGYPYGIPLNFVYIDGKIYFHGSKDGHKIDAIKQNNKVCFTIVNMEQNVPELFATNFESVIVFGRARILTDDDEIYASVDKLAQKFSPNEPKQKREDEIKAEWAGLCVVEITPEHITGKESIRQANARKENK